MFIFLDFFFEKKRFCWVVFLVGLTLIVLGFLLMYLIRISVKYVDEFGFKRDSIALAK